MMERNDWLKFGAVVGVLGFAVLGAWLWDKELDEKGVPPLASPPPAASEPVAEPATSPPASQETLRIRLRLNPHDASAHKQLNTAS
jgi:hypothetical protein